MAKAESIQHQAALAVTSAWQGSSRSKLYEDLRWEALTIAVCVGAFYRFIILLLTVNKTSSYLKDKLPPIREA